ncbi:MAG: LPS export ABC transporter permease LptF [Gammaproteobacteria bacterium]|nr:LPS export ABC transporter permease LptF [Gammaproteobacteria bacterium]
MILGRYVIREILKTMLGVLAVLLLIYVSNRFVRFLADASAGELAGQLIYQLLALKTLSAMTVLLPLSMFFATLLTFGRFYHDQEMAVIHACGVSSGWLVRRVLTLALGVAAVVAWISLFVSPWAESTSDRLIDGQNKTPETMLVAPGRFHEIRDGRGVVYVERQSSDGLAVTNIFMNETRRNGEQVIVSAPRAHFEQNAENGNDYLVMEDGYRYESDPVRDRFSTIEFAAHGILIEDRPTTPNVVQTREIPTRDLLVGYGPHQAELQWRFSEPLSVILLALLAVPLSRSQPRQGRFARMFMAILIYAIYSNLLGVSKHWVSQSIVSPFVGMWWVHLLILAWALLMIAQQSGRLQSIRRRFRREAVATS